MEAAAFALIVIVGLVGFGLVALAFMLRRTPEGAFPQAQAPGHWLLDDRFERILPPPPTRLAGKELDRRVAFKLIQLRPEQRAEFARSWFELERRFPDEPLACARAAHALSLEVMRARGYPVSDRAPANEPDQPLNDDPAELERTMLRYRSLLEAMIDLPPRTVRR